MSTPLPAPPDVRSLRFFYHPPGALRLTVGDAYSYTEVKVYQAWPLSLPGKHLSFHDSRGDEILMIEDLSELTPDAQPIVEEELRRRYLTSTVEAIVHIRSEFGVTYWHVETDRGPRDFVVQSLSESCIWLSERHLLLVDADGNRFEIPDRRALDPKSAKLLDDVI